VYVNNGDFQLPLIKGRVPEAVLRSHDVYTTIQEQQKANVSKPKNQRTFEVSDGEASSQVLSVQHRLTAAPSATGASVSVRLTDVLLDEFSEFTPYTGGSNTNKRKTLKYIQMVCEAASINQFMFDPRASSDKPIHRVLVLPKGVDGKEWLKQANVRFAEATKIFRFVF
jgi:hypothetical protein